jgi:hypothetical protein
VTAAESLGSALMAALRTKENRHTRLALLDTVA